MTRDRTAPLPDPKMERKSYEQHRFRNGETTRVHGKIWPFYAGRCPSSVGFDVPRIRSERFPEFMPAPKDMPQEIMTVVGSLMQAGYMTVVSGAEVVIAVLLLLNRFVPLALALLAPIIVGILTFHIAMAPATIGPGIVVAFMELYLAWAYRGAFKPLLAARAKPGSN